MSKNPWKTTVQNPPSKSLQDIMSEQCINNLIGIEENTFETITTKNDEDYARQLQEQYDKELCEALAKENPQAERVLQSTSTGPVIESSSSDDEWDEEEEDFDDYPDILVDGKHKEARLDKTSFDSLILNKLHDFGKMEEKGKKAKVKEREKEIATAEHAIDKKTRVLLYKLLNNDVLVELNGVISIGKEAVVLHAEANTIPQEKTNYVTKNIPSSVALKIYKTVMGEFRNRDKYIKNDYRFKKQFHKVNPTKLAHMWAEKEESNLKRLVKHGIPAPQPILLKKHILVMEFLGENSQAPARKINELYNSWNSVRRARAFVEVKDIMCDMYQKASLVHSDLSEYNLLCYKDKIYVIDVGQAVEPQHDRALEFLYRDCENICKFFGKKLGVREVPNARRLFLDVSGLEEDFEMRISELGYVEDETVGDVDERVMFLARLEEIQTRARAHAMGNRGRGDYKLEQSLID